MRSYHESIFQVLPKYRLRWIEAPVNHAHKQISIRVTASSRVA